MFYTLVIYPLTQIIEFVYSFCYKIFGNTGISVIGVSCAVSLLTLPLYIVAEHWQQVERDIQKRMKGEVDKIRDVFRGNERYMILSTYYRQQRYHPIMSLRSAFGLLIQIPFFTAAYACLSNMSALQGQSFLFIRDMGAPDALFKIGSFDINVLPIAMTLINMVSGTLYTRGLSIRDKIQTYGLALVFVAILYDSPAGLVMYWTMNNVFSLVKNVFYKLKNPVKTLYVIACALVTVFIVWLFAGQVLSPKRAALVSGVFSLVYFTPLFVKAANYLIDKTFGALRDNFWQRFFLFISAAAGLCVLTGLLIPSMLIATSPEEFSGIDGYGSPNFFIKNAFMQASGIFFVWFPLIYFLYKKRMQTVIAVALAIALPASFLNTFAFAGKCGTLSKLLEFAEDGSVESSLSSYFLNITSLAVLALLIVFFIKLKFSKILSFLFVTVLLGAFMFSLNSMNKITKSYKEYSKKIVKADSTSEIKPIFHFSKTGRNVLFLYLDRAQNRFIQPLWQEFPKLQEQFSGFTLFENTVSFNSHTLIGAAPCFGGYEYTPESINERKNETLIEKQNQALLLLPRIFTEQTQDFSATVTDSPWANWSWIPDLSIYKDYPRISAHLTDTVYLEKWYKEHADCVDLNVTSDTIKRNLIWFSFFRIAPMVLRPAFYNSGDYWAPDAKKKGFNDYLEGYSALDYLSKLTAFDSPTKNVYINFVNNATHDQMTLSPPNYRPSKDKKIKGPSKYANDIDYQSFAGAMLRVGEWFDILKQNDCYDNTRIVIVADHGATGFEDGYKWDEKFSKIEPGRYHPLLMFKDFGVSGPLTINNDYMTNADTPTLLTKDIIIAPKNPFTQKPLTNQAKDNGALVCLDDIYMPYHNKDKYVFTADKEKWYRVRDNIFDSANWTQEVPQ
ncbi:MAG: YidC/Oxa1 family membrane protein insertase [Treponema sp.]|nr:YidC/Oxa1 family membrane protein insertase [Treponema sp.]MEE3435028.1 YidC/Oxa1 family membrane protein insertase [Treponema sp.]